MKYLKKFNENIDYRDEFLDEIKDLIPDILNIKGVDYIFNGDPEISKIPETINHLKLYFKNVNLIDNKEIIKSDLSRVYKIMSYDYDIKFIYNKYYHILLALEDIIELFSNNYLRMGLNTISIVFKNKEKLYKESLSELSDKDSKFLDEIKDLIPDTFSLSKDKFSYDFNHTTKKYINPYHYISFNIDKIKKGEDYDIIISDLYRLYGILSNNYKISFSLEIHHPYEFHNDIDFKKCIEVINIVKNNNIEKSGKRKIGESLRSRIVELSIIFEL